MSQMGPGSDGRFFRRRRVEVGVWCVTGERLRVQLATLEPARWCWVVSGGSPVGGVVVSNDAAGLVGYATVADGGPLNGGLRLRGPLDARGQQSGMRGKLCGGSPVVREIPWRALALATERDGQWPYLSAWGLRGVTRWSHRQKCIDHGGNGFGCTKQPVVGKYSFITEPCGATWTKWRASWILSCEWGPFAVYRSEGGG